MYGNSATIPVIAIMIASVLLLNRSFTKSEAVMYPFSFASVQSLGIATSATAKFNMTYGIAKKYRDPFANTPDGIGTKLYAVYRSAPMRKKTNVVPSFLPAKDHSWTWFRSPLLQYLP